MGAKHRDFQDKNTFLTCTPCKWGGLWVQGTLEFENTSVRIDWTSYEENLEVAKQHQSSDVEKAVEFSGPSSRKTLDSRYKSESSVIGVWSKVCGLGLDRGHCYSVQCGSHF